MRKFATTLGILAAGLRQREERAKAEPLFGFTWLETWNEEVRSMAEFGVRPDGRFDGDSYGDSQRSDRGQPVLPRTGGVVDREGDVCDRSCCHPGVARLDPAEPDGLVARVRLLRSRNVELDAELWRLLVSA